MNNDYGYDCETYPNCFTLTAHHIPSGTRYVFEISTRKNDVVPLILWLQNLQALAGARMVGYNNISFDYNLIHLILTTPTDLITSELIYDLAQRIIKSQDRFEFAHRDHEILIPQLDLFRIWHFDNMAKSTSLKALAFAMRSHNIQDLPFEVGKILTPAEMDTLLIYNDNDVIETINFYHKSAKEIQFRETLSAQWETNLLNKNDIQIGADYFTKELTAVGINMGRDARTYRHQMYLNNMIFPYIQFTTPAFNNVLTWLKQQVITETKGVFKGLAASVNGFNFVFGTGGIHGSISAARVVADDQYMILDLDVTSYYPSVAIANKLSPEHLGEFFCIVYKHAFELRQQHKKGTVENALFKLALNGIFGKSNSEYSPFYDPAFTMGVTINGQLLLCMLAEWLLTIPGLSMIQANTDGLTVMLPRSQIGNVSAVAAQWEGFTCLGLETVEYSEIAIRDTNNYVAIPADTGKEIKTKGAYSYDKEWHQNHSALVIAKAATAYIVYGTAPEIFIRQHIDLFDFCMLAKVPRSSKLLYGEIAIQNTSRYFVATVGEYLTKQMPPTASQIAKHKADLLIENDPFETWAEKIKVVGYWGGKVPATCPPRLISINKNQRVQVCNDIKYANPELICFDYYISETHKLICAF